MNVHFTKSNEGPKPSFEEIFTKYKPTLIFYADRMVKDQLVAEDIVADVFIKYWNKQNDFTNAMAVKVFLDISTRNRCLNYLKQTQYHEQQKQKLLGNCPDHEDFVLNEMVQTEIRTELITAICNIIDSLPLECRRIILLGYVKGISNKKIAQLLKLSPNTVRNQKSIGLRLMKKRYQQLCKKRESNSCAA